MTSTGQRFSVVGTPITHTLSPRMHNAAFEAVRAPYTFDALDPRTSQGFAQWCQDVKHQTGNARGVCGFCTTIPYKQDAFTLCDEVSETARIIGAVNVVTRTAGGALLGDNTDAPGFLNALTHELAQQNVEPLSHDSRVVLCGTGGVARAIIVALIEARVGAIVISSRTLSRAHEFKAEFEAYAHKHGVVLEAVQQSTFSDVAQSQDAKDEICSDVHVCVNATPLGLKATDELVIGPQWMQDHVKFVFDAVYSKQGDTKLIAEAKRRAIACTDGRLMLAEQGIVAQEIWNQAYHFWDNEDEAQRAREALREALN